MRVNATRARENLETYAAAAFAKGEHSVEAIEADRARLLDEVRALTSASPPDRAFDVGPSPQINAAEVQKVTNLEREAFNADKVLEQILVISDKGRGEYYAAGGVEPEMGWDAVGEASWTRTNSGVKHPPRA